MELNKQKFSLAAAATMGILYVVCAVFVWLWPDFALKLLGWLVHLVNVDKFAGDVAITSGGLLAGLVQVLIYTYVGAWIFAWLHNRFLKSGQ
jgi:small-conductance mechanosensitive channel